MTKQADLWKTSLLFVKGRVARVFLYGLADSPVYNMQVVSKAKII